MAVSTSKPLSPFGHQLRPILEERRLSLRKLGRTLNPEKPEQARRDLIRWMYVGGKWNHAPGQDSRDRVADALGVDRSVFDVDEEDEEADELGRVLLLLVRRVVQHEKSLQAEGI